MEIRNTVCCDALRAYCEAAFDVIAQQSLLGGLPHEVVQTFEVQSPNRYSQSYVEKIDWLKLHDIIERRLDGAQVHDHLVQTMKDDPLISRHLDTLIGTSEAKQRFTAETCIRSFLRQLSELQKGGPFDGPVFDDNYLQLEDFFYRDTFSYRCFSPIEGFEMEAEDLELDPNISVIQFPADNQNRILSTPPFAEIASTGIVFNKFVFQTYVQVPKVFGDLSGTSSVPGPYEVAQGRFAKACDALRLFKRGAIGFNHIFINHATWNPGLGSAIRGPAVPATFRGEHYRLEHADIGEFLVFWQSYERAISVQRNRINLARRRFEFGYERIRPEDKLIDYMIGFEALLLQKNERQELGYRLALRGATLLGTTPEERQIVHQELYAAYRERSNIVHGAMQKEVVNTGRRKVRLSDFVNKTEDHLRATIRQFLARAEKQTESQIINDIDDKIIRGN